MFPTRQPLFSSTESSSGVLFQAFSFILLFLHSYKHKIKQCFQIFVLCAFVLMCSMFICWNCLLLHTYTKLVSVHTHKGISIKHRDTQLTQLSATFILMLSCIQSFHTMLTVFTPLMTRLHSVFFLSHCGFANGHMQVKSLSNLGVHNPVFSHCILDRSRRLINVVRKIKLVGWCSIMSGCA